MAVRIVRLGTKRIPDEGIRIGTVRRCGAFDKKDLGSCE
jgi:uncharacterized protein YeaO (DUF488 family)